MKLLFVGEERSEKAKNMNVTWKDGRLAAKQLFDALMANGINPKECEFTNIFERGGKTKVKNHIGVVVAMGNKVKSELEKMNVPHKFIYHPAARGVIRKKENYCNHIKTIL